MFTGRYLAAGGNGGFKRATSLKSKDAAAVADIGGGGGGGGFRGDGALNGASYLGGCTDCIGVFIADPKIHRAKLSQQPQHTSEIPWRSPR